MFNKNLVTRNDVRGNPREFIPPEFKLKWNTGEIPEGRIKALIQNCHDNTLIYEVSIESRDDDIIVYVDGESFKLNWNWSVIMWRFLK